MNSRLVEMILRGRLPFRGGQWIDTYNQITDPDCAGTIIAGINAKNHYYVMEEKKPIVSMELSGGVWDKRYGQSRAVYNPDGIAPTLITGGGGGTETKIAEPIVLGRTRDEKGNVVDRHPVEVANAVTAAKRDNTQNYVLEPTCVAMRGREPQAMTPKRTEHGKRVRKDYEAHKISEQRKNIQQLEPRTDGVTNTLTGVQKDNLIAIPANTADGQIMMEVGGVCDLSYPSSKTRRGRVQDGGKVTPTLTAHTENCLRRIDENYRIRKLTPRECFRLMGVSDADVDKIQAAGISKSQQYKMAGNSIVVNCLAAIFRQLFIGNFNKVVQTEIF